MLDFGNNLYFLVRDPD